MTREEFYNLTDILNTEVLGNFMHGGEADELIAMFEEAVEHSNILEQEESVSEELEEALTREWKGYNDRGTATVDALEDNTQELAFAKGFYRGAQWGKHQAEVEIQAQSMALAHGCPKESITEDLGDYINELSKQFPEVSFAKLSRIAVRVAKWQKEQMKEVLQTEYEKGRHDALEK